MARMNTENLDVRATFRAPEGTLVGDNTLTFTFYLTDMPIGSGEAAREAFESLLRRCILGEDGYTIDWEVREGYKKL